MKRDLRIEHDLCTFRITPSEGDSAEAEVVVERNGEVLYRANREYFWLIRECSPYIGETIWESLHPTRIRS